MALQSFYSQMLLALQQRITDEVPEIRWIDQDFGQLEIDTDRPSVSFPCVLIDFNGSQFSQLLQNIEMADNCVIQLRLAFPPFSPSNNLAPESVKDKALSYYEIENKLYKALKGYYPTYIDSAGNNSGNALCQPLNRIADATEKRDDTLRVRVLLFATSYEDDTANTTLSASNPGLSVTR